MFSQFCTNDISTWNCDSAPPPQCRILIRNFLYQNVGLDSDVKVSIIYRQLWIKAKSLTIDNNKSKIVVVTKKPPMCQIMHFSLYYINGSIEGKPITLKNSNNTLLAWNRNYTQRSFYNKRKNLYQVALLSTFYKGDHGRLIIQ